MGRRALMVLLGLGAVAGFGSEFARARHCNWRERHRQQVMAEFARTCTDAARAQQNPAGYPPPGFVPGYVMPTYFGPGYYPHPAFHHGPHGHGGFYGAYAPPFGPPGGPPPSPWAPPAAPVAPPR